MSEKNNIAAKLEKPEYIEMLNTILSEIKAGIDFQTKEAGVVSLMDRTIYHHCREFFRLSDADIQPIPEAGNTEYGMTHKFVGRMDEVYHDSFIIEYKHFSRLKTKEEKKNAIEQISEYMKQLNVSFEETQDIENHITRGLLTDGKQVMFFYYHEGRLEHTPFKPLDVDAMDKIVKNIVIRSCKLFVSQNIVKDFSVTRGDTCAKNLARVLFDSLKNENIAKSTESLIKEWEVLFHLLKLRT